MKLYKKIDIGDYKGTFVTAAQIGGKGRLGFLLSYLGPFSTTLRLIALSDTGEKLWEFGDPDVYAHRGGEAYNEPPCRGICTAFDMLGLGHDQVLAEMYENGDPKLILLDGDTGCVLAGAQSPFPMRVRCPAGYTASRPAPMAHAGYLNGKNNAPCFVLKYESSNRIPPKGAVMDAMLNPLWERMPSLTGIGHMITVADINGDGCDEIVLGELALNTAGEVLFEHSYGSHADMTQVFSLPDTGKAAILVGVCNHGPLYCLRPDGETIWEKTKEEISHGQGAWVGNFLHERTDRKSTRLNSSHT